MSQHTPGPWRVEFGQDILAGVRENRLVAECHAGHATERGANARLIAKAPEMYRLIKLSLQAGRFPEMGDGCEQWKPAEVARALLREIEGVEV